MTAYTDATVRMAALSYSGSGEWLDESGNGHHAQFGDGSTSSTYPVYADDHFTVDGTQYFEIAHHADLDFGAGDSLTMMVALEVSTVAGTRVYAGKRAGIGAGDAGYSSYYSANNYVTVCDGTVQSYDAAGTLSADTQYVLTSVRDVANDNIEGFINGVGSGSPATDATTLTIANGLSLNVGSLSSGSGTKMIGKIYGFALWPAALTEAEVAAYGPLLLPSSGGLFNESIAGPGQMLQTGG